jgi:hypothetical protein
MVLMNVVRDDTMAVAGFEHHTFMCSGCDDVERRLVFNKHIEPSVHDPAPMLAPEPIEEDRAPTLVPEPEPIMAAAAIPPALLRQSERTAAPGILRRMFSMLRGVGDAHR